MNREHEQLRAEMDRAMDHLRALRDEARVKVHLGSMEARDEWDRLQPVLREAERVAGQASRAALQSVEATVQKLSDLLVAL
jgi:hypothetical protein